MRDDRGGGRGDRPKKSWREVDAIRDKSRQRDGDPQRKASSPAAMQAAKSYRAALEKAFESGTLAELAKTLARNGEDAGPPGPSSTSPHGATPPAGSSAAGAPTPAQGTTAADAALNDAAPTPSAMPPPAPRDPERENRMKLLVKIKEAEGRDVITRAVDAYLARYPKLPADYEVLTKVLSHKDDDRVRDALAILAELAAREKPRRGRALVGQLRFLEETHSDADIRKTAADIRAKL